MGTFKTNRRSRAHSWQLGRDQALVLRDDRAQLVPYVDATAGELATGVASVEALAVHVLDSFLRSKRAHLQDHRRQDAIAYLIELAWIEANRFRPGPGNLGAYITVRLRWRLFDWYKVEFEGRPRSVEVLSLDAEDADRLHCVNGDGPHLERDIEAAHEARLLSEPEVDGVLGIRRDSLPVEARWALDHVALRLAAGFTMAEVMRATGRTRRVIDAAMDELRAELAHLR